MDEDDHDELLQCTDDESLSENDDHCLPVEKPEENYRCSLTYFNHSKLEFLLTKILLILSTFMILVLLPLYLEAVDVHGNAYSLLLVNTVFASVIFFISVLTSKCCSQMYRNLKIFKLPICLKKMIVITGIYFASAFLIIYALDRKRVFCHLQDPIKGIVLVFSLLYYFFFCRKLMGLQRIFSATTIIVGLFIAVDYGLCDEFRCRGYDRERISDDGGAWSFHTHAAWITLYIVGLAIFAAYFTLMERYILNNCEMEFYPIRLPSNIVNTVSGSVAFPENNMASSTQLVSSTSSNENNHLSRKHSVAHLAFWIHVFGIILVVALFWINTIDGIGKGSSFSEFWNDTTNGIVCHFTKPVSVDSKEYSCGNVSMFSWIFIFSYTVFVVMSIKFLVLTQSAVYTVATMSAALPLLGIWWSLFHVAPNSYGLLTWSPGLTGEMICALLGLPIIVVGLFLLCKAHFRDYQLSTSSQILSNNYLA